jgi:hypothetical protein
MPRKFKAALAALAVLLGVIAIPAVLAPSAGAQTTTTECTVYDVVTDAEVTSFPHTSVGVAVECDGEANVQFGFTLDDESYPVLSGAMREPIARPHDDWATEFAGSSDPDHDVQWSAQPDSTQCFIGYTGLALGTTCPFPVTGTSNPYATAHASDATAIIVYASDLTTTIQFDSVSVTPYAPPVDAEWAIPPTNDPCGWEFGGRPELNPAECSAYTPAAMQVVSGTLSGVAESGIVPVGAAGALAVAFVLATLGFAWRRRDTGDSL